MIRPPSDMLPELSAWNQGKGISLESWIGCTGNFRLAVGYSTIFWPRFVAFEGYVLCEGFNIESLRQFEQPAQGSRAVEMVMNHLHIADIQHVGCEDITEERIRFLGCVLREIYEAKLKWQFPDRTFEVAFFEPDDRTDLSGFTISFWQKENQKGDADLFWGK